jgi:hypothetical protein
MVLPNSDRAPRTPPYSGARSKEGHQAFAYAAIMLYGGVFQNSSANLWLCNFPERLPPLPNESHDPPEATPAGLTLRKFRLFRVRSPLLAESLLLSFPPGTEMVHFPGFALTTLCVQVVVTSLCWPGSPIRKSLGHGLFAPRQSLSQLTTSFIAFTRLGIHRVPLVA